MAFSQITSKPLEPSEADNFIDLELRRILETTQPKLVYLFGSGARGELTDASDLDFLIVLEDESNLKAAKKKYYSSRLPKKIAVDAVFVTLSEFKSRSIVGGICMVCLDEGKLLFPPNGAPE